MTSNAIHLLRFIDHMYGAGRTAIHVGFYWIWCVQFMRYTSKVLTLANERWRFSKFQIGTSIGGKRYWTRKRARYAMADANSHTNRISEEAKSRATKMFDYLYNMRHKRGIEWVDATS